MAQGKAVTYEDMLRDVGDRIRIEIVRRGCKAGELAESLGVPQSTLSNWMRGVRPASLWNLCRIAKELGCRLSALLPDDDEA